MSQLDQIRDAEAAKIARWFRETEYGWALFDRAGVARPISSARRMAWEGEALARLDRFIAFQRLVPKLLFAVPFVTALAWGTLLDLVPALAAVPIWAALVPPIGWLVSLAPRYHLAQRRARARWLASVAMYSPLPKVALERHRRHNGFAYARNALSFAAVGYAIWKIVAGDPAAELDATDMLIVAMLMGAGWLLHFAARRVDATHRRRRWAD